VVVSITATSDDTWIFSVPIECVQALCAREKVFGADLELRLLKEHARLDAILVHPVARHYFRLNLEETKSTENLDFWLEAHAFLNLDGETAEAEAEVLFESYVKIDSPKWINLPEGKRKSVEASMEQGHVFPEIFTPASLECYSLLQTDCLPRFKQSALFAEMVRDVAIGTSLQDVMSPPVKESSPSRKTFKRAAANGSDSSPSWRFRSASSSMGLSPRLSFGGKKDDLTVLTHKRTSSDTPGRLPISPLVSAPSLAESKLDLDADESD
jgi:hypothetical protein